MNRSAAWVLAIVLFGVVLWCVFYPTAVGAGQETFAVLPPAEFAKVRADAIAAAAPLEARGIRLNAGDPASPVFEFKCGNVPVLLLMNGPGVLSVMTFLVAESRSPGVVAFRDAMQSRLVPEGRPFDDGPPYAPGRLESFVLKHRDGIDLDARCVR
jgi:hypothetical protein